MKTYSELIQIEDYLDRYRYLKLGGKAFEETFGARRYLNQILYRSKEWRSFRSQIIERDNGCDMAHHSMPLQSDILIHHLNPLTYEDVLNRSSKIFDPENVVCVCLNTHNAIHYADESMIVIQVPIVRTPNDTCPWK